jgi:hypothetical protein
LSFEGEAPDAPFRIEGGYLAPFDYSDRIERDGLTMVFQRVPLFLHVLACRA